MKAKARREFDQTLETCGKRLDQLRAFVDAHPALRHPFYPVPHRPGITGTAAAFAAHVADLMDGRTALRRIP